MDAVMLLTGYRIREALRRWQLRRDSAEAAFQGSLKVFPDEKGRHPMAISDDAATAELAIARLQATQTRYNMAVTVTVAGEELTLLECIKRVGGLGRLERMWRKAAIPEVDRYALEMRGVDQVMKMPTVTADEAREQSERYAKILGALREAIAVGNAREVPFLDLDLALFE
jgi:hypothetical protein